MDCPIDRCLCISLSCCWVWTTRIAFGLHITVNGMRIETKHECTNVECVYLTSNVVQIYVTSTKVYMHGRGMWASKKRFWSNDIERCLPLSPLSITIWSSNIGIGLFSSPFDYAQCLVDVRRGLPALPLACTKWSANVGYRQAELTFYNAHWYAQITLP